MADNRLDLNKPLLSVRKQQQTEAATFIIPKLPPRYRKPELMNSGPIRNPGSVPFRWEASPGTPKQDEERKNQPNHHPPPGRRRFEAEESSSDDGGEYVDALSRAESSYLNCSISGLMSETHHPSSAVDQQTRDDFIINRFLPAAVAMAADSNTPPKYTPKKQPSAGERQQQRNKQAKKTAAAAAAPVLLRYGPSFEKRYALFGMDAGEDVDEEEGLHLMSARARKQQHRSSSSMKTFKDLLADDDEEAIPEEERTVYVDTVKNVGSASKENPPIQLLDDAAAMEDDDLKKMAAHQHGDDDKSQRLITDFGENHDSDLADHRHPGDSEKKQPVEATAAMLEKCCEKLAQLLPPPPQPQQKMVVAKVDDFQRRRTSHSRLLPPLPASPSDPWLHRILPSVSGKHHPSGRHFDPQKYGSKLQHHHHHSQISSPSPRILLHQKKLEEKRVPPNK